jgi:alpha-1,3-fucosyltransferase
LSASESFQIIFFFCSLKNTDSTLLDIVKNKTKTAVWLVSQCNQPSRRHILAQELQKYIDVDIFGKCGSLKCPPYPQHCVNYTNTYKFYFSFENSLCTDYITEKVYLTMQQLIIPILYNGVEISRFLPPRSYIDANAFATPEELAKHLKFLSDNPEEYVKYFWWRENYEIYDYAQTFKITPHFNFLTSICQKVNERKWAFEMQIYRKIDKWFDGCTKPKIKFE